MTAEPIQTPPVPSIDQVMAPFIEAQATRSEVDWGALRVALSGRESEIADRLRLAGSQFGLFPQIVAKALMDIGVGEPPSEVERDFINAQFSLLMEQMRREFGTEG